MRRSAQQIAADRESLVFALSGSEWKGTAEIDSERDQRQVYGDLRVLENRRLVRSRKVKGERRLFFCIKCELVVTAENYDECPAGGGHAMRPFYPNVKQWRLTAAGLRASREHELQAA